jgi:hypothetical protein
MLKYFETFLTEISKKKQQTNINKNGKSTQHQPYQ